MPKWLFLTVCYLTYPIRLLIPRYNNFRFSLDFLFGNQYKSAVLFAQAQQETADFTSKNYVEYNNAFGMRGAVGENCQDGVRVQGTDEVFTTLAEAKIKKGNSVQTYAIYKNDYKCVYDYYLYLTERTKNPLIALNLTPQNNFDNDSSSYPFQIYVYTYIDTLKQSGYFTGDLTAYKNRVYNFGTDYSSSRGRYIFNIVFTVVLYVWVVLYIFNRTLRGGFNKKVTNVFKRK